MTMLIPCVIDASVLIKLFLQEEHSTDIQFLMRCYLGEGIPTALTVPDLIYVECANILWVKVQQQLYTTEDAQQALAQLRLLALPTTPSCEVMERALQIACQFAITAYDACYVALAEHLVVPVLTADAKLAQHLHGSPHRILLVQDYLHTLLT